MVVIKRLRVDEKGESIELRSIEDMAMPVNQYHHHHHQYKRVFECKTCSKQFASFQALGGHRASHKRPRLETLPVAASKPKVHECSICGVEFAIGQALGGHMRRHRARVDEGCSSGKEGLCLDLTLAPSGDMNSVYQELELGLELRLGLGHVH